jgi:RHS repeat-associated protein
VRLSYAYDHQSRRVSRRQYVWLQDDWSLSNVQAFRYDGWNLIAETSPAATNLYAWGLDLSGSLQGAGGIGGLLAGVLAKNEEPGARNLVAYAPDANGNVMQLVDATDGTLAAAYEYTPFGETIASTGPLAKANPFRFSTKWVDNDTGLGYWGYRWYGPGMGRWLCRDPIGEKGGINLFVYALNRPNSYADKLGQAVLPGVPENESATKSPLPPIYIDYSCPMNEVASGFCKKCAWVVPGGRRAIIVGYCQGCENTCRQWCAIEGARDDARNAGFDIVRCMKICEFRKFTCIISGCMMKF